MPPLEMVTSPPPGRWLVESGHGHPLALVWLGATALLMLAAMAWAAADCYPELWEASRSKFALAHFQRRGGIVTPGDELRALRNAGIDRAGWTGTCSARWRASAGGGWVPGGAGALLWKEWLAVRRERQPLTRLGLLAGLCGGTTLGLLALLQGAGGLVVALVNATFVLVLDLIAQLSRSVPLALELRTPIWRLSVSALRTRLGVCALASSLRVSSPFIVGMMAAAAIIHSPRFLLLVLLVVVVVVVLFWLVRVLGLVAFAVLPSSMDMRGPGGLLRFLLLPVAALPIASAAGLALLTRSGLASIAGGLVAGMAVGLTAFAAWRIGAAGIAMVQEAAR